MEPTKEQQAAQDHFLAGHEMALVAGAGTGKTATLVLMGNATRKRGLYMAFNRSIAHEAKTRFGSNVECRTAHSLAFQDVGKHYRDRLEASARIPTAQTAKLLGIRQDIHIGRNKISVKHQARLVMGMLRRFCYSTDPLVMARHLEPVNGLAPAEQEWLATTLLPYATWSWQDVCSPNGKLRFEHDHYMKMWALKGPRLRGEFLLLDEAQDTNPVLEEVFLNQDAQRVCVGDPAQQIYGWRSARDVMTGFPADHLYLTQSFRFGAAIADQANRWLVHAESPMRLTGWHAAESRVGEVPAPDAVLCRSNADAMGQVLHFLGQNVPVALTGGGSAIARIATASQELKSGRRTSHPELFLFNTWAGVQEYVDTDKAGQDLKAIVDLVDTYGPDTLLQAVNRLSSEEAARVTVSTAHKAKGREWDNVLIGPGFAPPGTDDEGDPRPIRLDDARLAYVAVSRARRVLDPAGVAWLDAYEAAQAPQDPSLLLNLSLTGQLKYQAAPITAFLTEHLPTPRRLVGDYQRRLKGLPHPVQPLDVRNPHWPALGHAIDYRLRLSLGADLGGAVELGVDALAGSTHVRGAPDAPVRAALHSAGEELLEEIDNELADPGTATSETLTRLCYVAGFYEDIFRTSEIRRGSMLKEAHQNTALSALCDAVPSYVIEDIDHQLDLAQKPFAPFRALPEEQRTCGPGFPGSRDIGGADADFILGGKLVDCKASTIPRRLGIEEVYQLAGYLLLDYNDQFAINSLALYLSRQGALIEWTVKDFLNLMGCRQSLATLRSEFRTHLRAARQAPPA